MATGNAVGPNTPMPGTERRERLPGEADNFERPDDPPGVVGVDARRGLRVDAAELGVRRRHAARLGRPRLELGAEREVLAGEPQIVEDGLHVESRAPDQQRPPPARLDVGDGVARLGLEPHDRPLVVRLGYVDQVVRYRRPFDGRRLRRPDVETPVHLHRVDGTISMSPSVARDVQRNGRLPRRRRTDERQVLSSGGAPGSARACAAAPRRRSIISPASQCGAARVTRTLT